MNRADRFSVERQGGQNNKDEVCNDDQRIKLTAKKFPHQILDNFMSSSTPESATVKPRTILFESTWSDSRRFLILLVVCAKLGVEIFCGQFYASITSEPTSLAVSISITSANSPAVHM